jgi:putative Holliday junction resolvase
MNRFLGIDYGTKRTGLAVSDENGTLAFPREVVLNDINIFKHIENVLEKENISEIVLGESTNFVGLPNILSAKVDSFILKLKEKFKIPIHKQKEFLTSLEARRSIKNLENLNPRIRQNKPKKINPIDASAAALILQRYLDKKNS